MKSVNINELKYIQLKILEKVDEFCEVNNIKYILAYGTLIGAVRHKGYIPWDDDIDIAMPRPDYEKFLQEFNGWDGNLEVISYELNKKFLYTFAKVVDKNTVLIEKSNVKFPLGINIDVFPIDGIEFEGKVLRKQKRLRVLLDIKSISISKSRAIYKNLILKLTYIMIYWLPTSWIIKKMIRNSKTKEYFSSDNVCISVLGTRFNKPINKKKLESVIDGRFEGRVFKIPAGYDEWLKSIFGNYMELPPKEKRVSHHKFEAYRNEEDI